MSAIVAKNNDYVVKVKGNQKHLLTKMQSVVRSEQAKDRHTKKEINRGSKENRLVKTYAVTDSITKDWNSAKTIIYVLRTTIRKGETTVTESFYLSSIELGAAELSMGVRNHWGIENQLHYVKDVVAHEDAVRIKQSNAAASLAVIRNGMLSAFRINGYWSIKRAIRQYGGNLQFLIKMLE